MNNNNNTPSKQEQQDRERRLSTSPEWQMLGDPIKKLLLQVTKDDNLEVQIKKLTKVSVRLMARVFDLLSSGTEDPDIILMMLLNETDKNNNKFPSAESKNQTKKQNSSVDSKKKFFNSAAAFSSGHHHGNNNNNDNKKKRIIMSESNTTNHQDTIQVFKDMERKNIETIEKLRAANEEREEKKKANLAKRRARLEELRRQQQHEQDGENNNKNNNRDNDDTDIAKEQQQEQLTDKDLRYLKNAFDQVAKVSSLAPHHQDENHQQQKEEGGTNLCEWWKADIFLKDFERHGSKGKLWNRVVEGDDDDDTQLLAPEHELLVRKTWYKEHGWWKQDKYFKEWQATKDVEWWKEECCMLDFLNNGHEGKLWTRGASTKEERIKREEWYVANGPVGVIKKWTYKHDPSSSSSSSSLSSQEGIIISPQERLERELYYKSGACEWWKGAKYQRLFSSSGDDDDFLEKKKMMFIMKFAGPAGEDREWWKSESMRKDFESGGDVWRAVSEKNALLSGGDVHASEHEGHKRSEWFKKYWWKSEKYLEDFNKGDGKLWCSAKDPQTTTANGPTSSSLASCSPGEAAERAAWFQSADTREWWKDPEMIENFFSTSSQQEEEKKKKKLWNKMMMMTATDNDSDEDEHKSPDASPEEQSRREKWFKRNWWKRSTVIEDFQRGGNKWQEQEEGSGSSSSKEELHLRKEWLSRQLTPQEVEFRRQWFKKNKQESQSICISARTVENDELVDALSNINGGYTPTTEEVEDILEFVHQKKKHRQRGKNDEDDDSSLDKISAEEFIEAVLGTKFFVSASGFLDQEERRLVEEEVHEKMVMEELTRKEEEIAYRLLMEEEEKKESKKNRCEVVCGEDFINVSDNTTSLHGRHREEEDEIGDDEAIDDDALTVDEDEYNAWIEEQEYLQQLEEEEENENQENDADIDVDEVEQSWEDYLLAQEQQGGDDDEQQYNIDDNDCYEEEYEENEEEQEYYVDDDEEENENDEEDDDNFVSDDNNNDNDDEKKQAPPASAFNPSHHGVHFTHDDYDEYELALKDAMKQKHPTLAKNAQDAVNEIFMQNDLRRAPAQYKLPLPEVTNPHFLKSYFTVLKFTPNTGLFSSGPQKRIWVVDHFSRTFYNLDNSGKIKKEHAANKLLQIERNLSDPTRLRLMFFDSSHSYELQFFSPLERERFFETAQAIRPSIRVYAPDLTNQDVNVEACTTTIDGVGPNTVSVVAPNATGKPVKRELTGECKINASKLLTEPVTIWTGTFNLSGKPPPRNQAELNTWIPKDKYDIYAVACQEASFRKDEGEWFEYIQRHLGRDYLSLASMNLWDSLLIVLAKKKHLLKITCVEGSTKATQHKQVCGTKGGIGISLRFLETSFAFVTCQLAARVERTQMRNTNVEEIVDGLQLGIHETDFLSQFNHVFFFGDFNYRLELDSKAAMEKIEAADYANLLTADQLTVQKSEHGMFAGFEEPPITFPPTYRMVIGPQGAGKYQAEKGNAPSYCDRVLTRSMSNTWIKCTSYASAPKVTTSEHQPVAATFITRCVRPTLSCFMKQQAPIPLFNFMEVNVVQSPGVIIKKPQLLVLSPMTARINPIDAKAGGTQNPQFDGRNSLKLLSVTQCQEYLETCHFIFVIRDAVEKRADKAHRGTAVLELGNKIVDKGGVVQEFNLEILVHGKACGRLVGKWMWISSASV